MEQGDICGYSVEELTGAPHTIVRHPDMHKAGFKGLWVSIKQVRSKTSTGLMPI
jgi:hypothetical protein